MKPSVAIVIRGQVREWDNAKHSILNLAKTLSEAFDVVFFFATWDLSYLPTYHQSDFTGAATKHDLRRITDEEIESIKKDFVGFNLADFRVIEYAKVKETAIRDLSLNEEYEYIAFIRYYANLMKQHYESSHDMVFHSVLELRPDLYVLPTRLAHLQELSRQIPSFIVDVSSPIFSRTIELEFSEISPQFNCLLADDLIIYSDSYTSDLVNNEFHHLKKHKHLNQIRRFHPHHLFSDHLLNLKLINIHGTLELVTDMAIIRPKTFFLSSVDFTELSAEVLAKVKIANGIFQNTKELLANNQS